MGTTAAQKKLFFTLRRMMKNLDAYEDTDLHPEDVNKIATDLGVPEQEVVNMNRRMMMGGDGSLNVPMRNGEDGSGEWMAWLKDDGPLQDELVADAQESEVRHDMLVEAMDSLNDREKHILTERRLTENPQTLEELSQVYDVSRERIRQIEVRAFEKVQKAMKAIAGEKLLAGVACPDIVSSNTMKRPPTPPGVGGLLHFERSSWRVPVPAQPPPSPRCPALPTRAGRS